MARFKPGMVVTVETDDIPFTATVESLVGQSDDADLQRYRLRYQGTVMSEAILGMFLRASVLDAVAAAAESGPPQMNMSNVVVRAARFARTAHGGQKRDLTGDPYIRHPGRVASRVTLLNKELGDDLTSTEEMVVAAWLHDVAEDTPTTLDQIQSEFGVAAASLVSWLTNEFTSKKHPKAKRAQRKELELARLRAAPIEARAIKFLDRIDNLREIDHRGSFARVYVAESDDLAEAIGDGLPVLKAELEAEIAALRERMG